MQENTSQSSKLVIGLLAAASIFITILITFLVSSDDLPSTQLGGKDGQIGGDFTLHGIDGRVSLKDFRGKAVILYFGFVNCSQVCPISMRTMQAAVEKLSPEEAQQLQVIFISVDGNEDSFAELDEYATSYHPDFIGITGNPDNIFEVVDEYGAYFSPTELRDVDPSRAYRHSSRYYIIDQQGDIIDAMRHSATANEIVARLRTLI
jgi:protein SCO1/2